MTKVNQRVFSPYEKTHLLRFGRSDVLENPDLAEESPVEYLTGHVEFAKLNLHVSSDTLIPRVETEGLVQRAAALVLQRSYTAVADIGTGCGAIALGLAHQLKLGSKTSDGCRVYASDISAAALAVAKMNLEQYPQLATHVELIEANLLQGYKPESLDLIIANLPYIPESVLHSLDASVLQYEPMVALDGGHNGFALIAKLLEQAPKILRERGSILLELDYTHDSVLFSAFERQFDISFFPDYRNVRRFAQLDLKSDD